MCSYFFNFRIINAIFRPPKKLDLEQWPRPLFEVLGYWETGDDELCSCFYFIFAYGNLPQHSEWPETYSEDLRFEERIILDRGIPFLPPRSVITEVQ